MIILFPLNTLFIFYAEMLIGIYALAGYIRNRSLNYFSENDYNALSHNRGTCL